MATLAELETKWQQRLVEWRALGVSVSGERIADEILADIRTATAARSTETLTPKEAAAITNYHPESIARMVRAGQVTNYGTKYRPRVKLDELPTKAAPTPAPRRRLAKTNQSGASSAVRSIDSISRDAVAGRIGRG